MCFKKLQFPWHWFERLKRRHLFLKMSLDVFRLFEKQSDDDLNSQKKDIAAISMLMENRIKSNELKYCYYPIEDKIRNYDEINANFKIAFSTKEIFVKFQVKEQVTRAIYSMDFQDIWKDSCVEFFISFTDYQEQKLETNYFNFELNSIGRCLSMKGNRHVPDRKNMSSIDQPRLIRTFSSSTQKKNNNELSTLAQNISKLQTFKELNAKSIGETEDNQWELTVAIPWDLFPGGFETCISKTIRANFYKCGDELSKPHWISYFPIGSETPSFHRPEFFGKLNFKV